MQFFEFKQLPEKLQAVSKPFGELATAMDTLLPNNPEKSAMLRKLLEAKDCAVRAAIFKTGNEEVPAPAGTAIGETKQEAAP